MTEKLTQIEVKYPPVLFKSFSPQSGSTLQLLKTIVFINQNFPV